MLLKDDSKMSLRKELMVFLSRTVAKRTQPSQRQSVHHYSLGALGLMADHYPLPSAFSLLNQVIDEYQKSFGDSWKTATTTEDSIRPWLYLDEALAKFQYPPAAGVDKFQDDTKIILHKTLDSFLAPGEKLDSLIEKSTDLSAASQERLLGERKQVQIHSTLGIGTCWHKHDYLSVKARRIACAA